MSRKTIIKAIVGGDKPWIDDTDGGRQDLGEPVFVANGMTGGRVRDLSFELRSGEILGFAGLPGSGAEEALDLLFARSAASGGQLRAHGKVLTLRSPRDAKNAGIALVPKNRHAESLLSGQRAARTSRFRTSTALSPIPSPGSFDAARNVRRVRKSRGICAIKMSSIEASIDSLSGGNQQRRSSPAGWRAALRFSC